MNDCFVPKPAVALLSPTRRFELIGIPVVDSPKQAHIVTFWLASHARGDDVFVCPGYGVAVEGSGAALAIQQVQKTGNQGVNK